MLQIFCWLKVKRSISQVFWRDFFGFSHFRTACLLFSKTKQKLRLLPNNRLILLDLRKIGVHQWFRLVLGKCGAHFAQSLEEILPGFETDTQTPPRHEPTKKTHRGEIYCLLHGKTWRVKICSNFARSGLRWLTGWCSTPNQLLIFARHLVGKMANLADLLITKHQLVTEDVVKSGNSETNPCWIWYWWDMSTQKKP